MFNVYNICVKKERIIEKSNKNYFLVWNYLFLIYLEPKKHEQKINCKMFMANFFLSLMMFEQNLLEFIEIQIVLI